MAPDPPTPMSLLSCDSVLPYWLFMVPFIVLQILGAASGFPQSPLSHFDSVINTPMFYLLKFIQYKIIYFLPPYGNGLHFMMCGDRSKLCYVQKKIHFDINYVKTK